MKLQDKFVNVFIYPLILGIFILVILTMVILIVFAQKFRDLDITERIQAIETGKIQPLILTATNLLYKKFQKTTYSLITLKGYYDIYASAILNNSTKVNTTIIDKHLNNSIYIYKNYTEYIKTISQDNNSTYLDHASWSYDGTTVDYTEMIKDSNYNLVMKHLTIISHLTPIYKSIYKTSMDNTHNRIEWLYFASNSSGIISGYPIYNDNRDFYGGFVKGGFVNDISCRDKYNNVADYTLFSCRDWWYQIEDNNLLDTNDNIIISHPYKFSQNGMFGVTICIKFKDILLRNYTNNLNSICADIDLTDIFTIFEQFNNELSGYFYTLRVGSDIPLYYPSLTKEDTIFKLQYFEFGMKQPYYISELTAFTNEVVPNMIKDYKDIAIRNKSNLMLSSVFEGHFSKNGTNNTYLIFPVFLYIFNDKDPEHRLSIIYIRRSSAIEQNLQNFQTTVYPRLVIQLFLILIMCSIIVIVAWFLINIVAANIINPIINLKKLIQGINIEEEEASSKMDKNGEDNDMQNFRSAEMDKLYDILLKLKNVLSFTSNSKVIYDKSALINYVNAKYTFNEVSNYKGKTVCDSNVGNLAIKFNKYDKAIFHLTEVLDDLKKYGNLPILDTIVQDWRRSIHHRKVVTAAARKKKIIEDDNRTVTDNIVVLSNTVNNSNLLSIQIFLESRFPKLIYSYKKFFKLLKKVGNDKQHIDDFIKSDFYIYKDKQSLECYENALCDYIALTMHVNDNRKVAEAILEYIGFIITFRLKVDRHNLNSINITEELKMSKMFLIEKITMLLKDFDLAYIQLEKSYNNPEYYKMFIENLKTFSNKNEAVEIPHLILLQKSYFIKGKLAKLCGHHQRALEYFVKSMEMNIICDANLIQKSIKQINKLMEHTITSLQDEIIKENLKLGLLEDRTANHLGTRKIKDRINKIKDTITDINTYTETMKVNLELFNYTPKDIVVLIDSSESMRNDNKKIQHAGKVINTIYDKYITGQDSFSLFIYDVFVNTIISLHRKDYSNYTYVKSMIENIGVEIYKITKDLITTENSKIFKAIEYCNKYLLKKSKNKEKWIIVFTDRIYVEDSDEEIINSFKDEGLNVVVVGSNLPQYEINFLNRSLYTIGNRSQFIDYEDISKFKNIFRCHGQVKEEFYYPNEKYESDKR